VAGAAAAHLTGGAGVPAGAAVPSNGTLHWVGGLTIAGWTVESAEYRPESSGRPNINLHYRRQAGGNLNSMSCTRH
jgi:hypothetical protein